MKFWITALAALQILTSYQSAFAHESEEDAYGYHDESESQTALQYDINESDATRIQKFEAALDTLGIPHESAPDFSNYVHANEANQTEVQNNLPYLDPDKGFSRYLSIANGNIQMFRDFFKSMISLDYLEYQQSLSTENPSNDSSGLLQRLKAIAYQTQSRDPYPLTGLKILIDPGHMGGNEWDKNTGKYVSVKGRKVSEGNLNLWTAMLTAQRLEKLGATVLLTREQAGPVSTENLKTFDTTPYINHFFYSSMDDWMAPYLERSIDEVKSTIKDAPSVQKAYSDAQRLQFFIAGADLEARAKMMDSFNPDITIDIHFDASKTDQLQSHVQSLEAFVPGSFRKNETGSRKSKAMALKHLLEVRRWNQSVELADQVTKSMSTALKIPRLSIPEGFSAIKVRDGVYARNLYITRRALSSLVIYLECLHYDHVKEHRRLSFNDRSGFYRGKSFYYPNRLDTISSSIENGVLEYFRNLKN